MRAPAALSRRSRDMQARAATQCETLRKLPSSVRPERRRPERRQLRGAGPGQRLPARAPRGYLLALLRDKEIAERPRDVILVP